MKRKMVAVIMLLLLSFTGWRIYQKVTQKPGNREDKEDGAGTVSVVVQPVRREAIRDVQTYTGTVFPRAQYVVAPQVAGRLEKLLVNIGSEVKNGDLIARLDDQEYKLQVEQARAELDVAKANVSDSQSAVDITTRDLERVNELRKQQVASEAEMDQAEANRRAAQAKNEVALAQVKQQEAVLKANEVRLSYTRISAAWEEGDGPRLVGERFVDEGTMLGVNEPIISILDVDIVIAAIFIIERDYPHIQVGQSAVIATDAFPQKTFTGQIVRKAPILKESSRQARVEIEVANPERLLVPGMFIRSEIQFAARDSATVVPVSALVRRNGMSGVFLADTTAMKARFVPVTIGIVNGELAEITNPPLEGSVVTMGQHLLEDGAAFVIPSTSAPTVSTELPTSDLKGAEGSP